MHIPVRTTLLILLLSATICGCAHEPDRASGSKEPIPYERFETMYFQMSEDGGKAYLFFSEPDCLIVGLRKNQCAGDGPSMISINFIGLANTGENRSAFGTMPVNMIAMRSGRPWVKELDTGSRDGEEFVMYYAAPGNPTANRIPCTGVVRDSDLPMRPAHSTPAVSKARKTVSKSR